MPPPRFHLSEFLRHPRISLSTLGLAVLVVVALATGAAVGARSSAASVGWRGDFETGNFDQWTFGVQEKDPSRATIVTSVNGGPPREGRYAARFEVQAGDNNVGGSGSGERTEALIPTGLTGGTSGSEQWWAWSTLFDPGFQANDSSWNAITQWHNSGTSGGTTGFQVRGSELWFQVWGGDPANPSMQEWKVADRTNGVWYDFLFHVNWSSDRSVGFVQVFVNGREVVARTSAATLYNGEGVYLKQGYYRNAQPYTAVLYFDGTRRAETYAEAVQGFPAGSWPSTLGASTPAPVSAPAPAPATTTTVTTPAPATSSPTSAPAPSSGTSAPAPSAGGSGSGSAGPASASGNGSGGSAAHAGADSPASASDAQPGQRVPSAVVGVRWDKRLFTSANALRNALAVQSISWEAFLQLHTGAVEGFHLKTIVYGESFFTKQALVRWLTIHHQRYDAWATAHPAAAGALESQPAGTASGERLLLRATRAERHPRTLRVVAHAFPGARARVLVSAGTGRLAAVTTVVDYGGRLDSLVPLRRAATQQNLLVSLTAMYPEGPRTVRTILRPASRVSATKHP